MCSWAELTTEMRSEEHTQFPDSMQDEATQLIHRKEIAQLDSNKTTIKKKQRTAKMGETRARPRKYVAQRDIPARHDERAMSLNRPFRESELVCHDLQLTLLRFASRPFLFSNGSYGTDWSLVTYWKLSDGGFHGLEM